MCDSVEMQMLLACALTTVCRYVVWVTVLQQQGTSMVE